MVHIPGAKHHAVDAISRKPTGDEEQLILIDDIANIDEKDNQSEGLSFQDIHHYFLSSIL